MHRFLRYLRIAFSATCGIACVLLIVLWVRSYWWMDSTGYLTSVQGKLFVQEYLIINSPTGSAFRGPCGITSLPTGWGFVPIDGGVTLPIWSLVVPMAILAAVPWIRWRFSLRTLLIATTLVAVVLGLIVWLVRT